MSAGEIPFDVVVAPREQHDWVDRAGRGWSWALAEVLLPGFPRTAGFRVTVLVSDDDHEGDAPGIFLPVDVVDLRCLLD